MILSIAAVLAFSSITTIHAEHDEPAPVKLEYNFAGKDSFSYTQTSTMTQSQSMFGNTTNTSTTSISEMTRSLVETLDDGSLVISDQSTLQEFRNTTPDEQFLYIASNPEDAQKADDPRVAPALAINDWSVEYIISPIGEVLGVRNAQEIQELASDVEREGLRKQLQAGYTEEAMTTEFEPTVFLLPEDPVTVGDQWSRSYTMAADPMQFVINQTMTVQSVADIEGGKYIRVKFEGEMDITLPPDFPAFMKVTTKTVSGSFVFKTTLGTISEYDMVMNIVMSGSPNPSMGEISVSTTAGNSYKLITE